MNYQTVVSLLWKRRKDVPLLSSEADFLYFIIHSASVIEADSVSLATKDICESLGITRKAVADIRRRLSSKGYIRYTEGARFTDYTLAFVTSNKTAEEKETMMPTRLTVIDDRSIGIDLTLNSNEITDEIFRSETIWIENICMIKHINLSILRSYILQFTNTLICDGTKWKERADFLRHFNRWLDIELNKQNNNAKQSTTKQQQRQQQICDRQSVDANRIARLEQAYSLQGGYATASGLPYTSGIDARFQPDDSEYPFK